MHPEAQDQSSRPVQSTTQPNPIMEANERNGTERNQRQRRAGRAPVVPDCTAWGPPPARWSWQLAPSRSRTVLDSCVGTGTGSAILPELFTGGARRDRSGRGPGMCPGPVRHAHLLRTLPNQPKGKPAGGLPGRSTVYTVTVRTRRVTAPGEAGYSPPASVYARTGCRCRDDDDGQVACMYYAYYKKSRSCPRFDPDREKY
jgi:hypothetical protein